MKTEEASVLCKSVHIWAMCLVYAWMFEADFVFLSAPENVDELSAWVSLFSQEGDGKLLGACISSTSTMENYRQ